MGKDKKKRILFTGGGTGGSVSPLLAVADFIRESCGKKQKEGTDYNFLWIGTKDGPEKIMVDKAGIEFLSINSGRLRRYFSWRNFTDPFKILAGFFQSIFILIKKKPELIMSAGGFVSVPVVWAAWLLRKKIIIHQQDVRPGLANKLMAPFTDVITVCFEKSLVDYGKKAKLVGNPVKKEFKIEKSKPMINHKTPILLITGGGTGAQGINDLVKSSLSELLKFCQVRHVLGKDKGAVVKKENYEALEFLSADEMAKAMHEADLVVSRSGLNALTELSFLAKPAILIPMPDSHQEDNAKLFGEAGAAVVLEQKKITPELFVAKIKELIGDSEKKEKLSGNIYELIKKDAEAEMVKIINYLFYEFQ